MAIMVIIVCLVQFLTSVEWGMFSALIPFIGEHFAIPKSNVIYLTAGFAAIGIISPLFCLVADRRNKKELLKWAVLIYAIGTFLSGASINYLFFALGRLITAIGTFTLNATLISYLSDFIPYEKRGNMVGKIRLAWALSVFLAPVYGTQVISRLGFSWTYWFCTLAALIAWILVLKLPASNTTNSQDSLSWKEYSNIFREPVTKKIILIAFGWAATPILMYSYLAIWLQTKFGLEAYQMGVVFSLITLGSMIGAFLSATFSDKIGKARMVKMGMLLMLLAVTPLPNLNSIKWIIVCSLLVNVGLDSGWSSFQAVVSQLNPGKRTVFVSLISASSACSSLFFACLSPAIFKWGGYSLIITVGVILSWLALLLTFSLTQEKGLSYEIKY